MYKTFVIKCIFTQINNNNSNINFDGDVVHKAKFV